MSRVDEIELARGGIGIQLLVPSSLFAHTKPLDDAPVFFRRQAIDSSLDLVNSAHTWSLSPSCVGFHRVPETRPRRVVRAANSARYPAHRDRKSTRLNSSHANI